jgi:hypothetical protein
MLKRTTNYADAHQKAKVNSPRTTIQNHEQRPEQQQKNRTLALKKSSALTLTLPEFFHMKPAKFK